MEAKAKVNTCFGLLLLSSVGMLSVNSPLLQSVDAEGGYAEAAAWEDANLEDAMRYGLSPEARRGAEFASAEWRAKKGSLVFERKGRPDCSEIHALSQDSALPVRIMWGCGVSVGRVGVLM